MASMHVLSADMTGVVEVVFEPNGNNTSRVHALAVVPSSEYVKNFSVVV